MDVGLNGSLTRGLCFIALEVGIAYQAGDAVGSMRRVHADPEQYWLGCHPLKIGLLTVELMRSFNKVFVVALPRCATVSMCDGLGIIGVPTAHLGRIYGEQTEEHSNPARLKRMHEQISANDYCLDILEICSGLADYPACAFSVIEKLDAAWPGSLFINIRRDRDITRWLQSVERQFIGLQLVKSGKAATEEEKEFMQVMLSFREMTFGQAQFDAEAYAAAYRSFQDRIATFFSDRSDDLLEFEDIAELEDNGFLRLCEFLDCPMPEESFPRNNQHSNAPYQAFMQALEEGRIQSQTGIRAVEC